jgi:flagellar biosynthetic protein FliO
MSMVTRNKKIIVLLIIVGLSGSIISVRRAQSATDESIKSLPDNSASSSFTNDPNIWMRSGGNLSTREMFYKMMFAVLLVVVLGAAALYISKKFVPRITCLSGKKIQVFETVHLGPRKAVHLIKIGNRRLLIGSTNESITKLADVTDALAETNLSTKEINGK